MSMLERAIEIALKAHRAQVDKAGEPYILHPLRVMLRLNSSEERQVGILHDVVEDSDWTIEQLGMEGFSENVVAAVEALTRRDGEDYFDFIRRAANHSLARKVKKADLLDNMDLKRIMSPSNRDFERLKRYEQAMMIIEEKELLLHDDK
jgi:(p)ppGpp synthase/HD superfamily hydrolase